jgi:cellulose synthase/poly-beta-1,6-N-acetylglucosamine synthase-like glycosyltransferase
VPQTLLAVGCLSLAIWLYLAVARGNFWRLHEFDDDTAKHESPIDWPPVVAIIPARNEAATIAQVLSSLLKQNYAGEFSVVLVDDHSEDATAQIARQATRDLNAESRIKIYTAPALPSGWTGKLWALNSGTAILGKSRTAISGCPPTTSISPAPPTTSRTAPNSPGTPTSLPAYFWFTDADIVHAPDTLQRLVARADRDQLDLASLMVLLQAKTLAERALIPAFLFFFLKLYPPRWIADPKASAAGAAGGCILLRREALERIGGFAAIRNEVIDDCALARAVKRSGGRLWMGLTRASVSLRAYTTFAEIRDLIARTAFTQLSYSPLLLLGTLLGMFLTYLAPVMLLFVPRGAPQILGASTWLLMSLLYLPTIRFYRLSPTWAAILPLTALFYSYATFLSTARYYLGRGGQWKGRSQVKSPS